MKLHLAFIALFLLSPTLLNNIKASNITDFKETNVIPKKFSGELTLDMLQGILEKAFNQFPAKNTELTKEVFTLEI